MDEKEMIEIALPVVKKVVNWLSAKQYKKLPDVVVLDDDWTPALVKEELVEYLKLNELHGIDPFGTPLKEMIANHEYKQMSVIPYKDGSGFHLDYDLTSRGGEWNDLTLQLSFEKNADGEMIPHFKDLHVM